MFIPVYLAGVSKSSKVKYNNESPRDHISILSGKGKNAHSAEQNCYESFPAFFAAVIAAQWMGNDQATIDVLAIVFVLSRILHATFYLTNKGTLRSIAWLIGFASTIALFVAG
tara:strand:- start:157 stop:495 length:339 start_codon:yes stop_codon:yes gene_type:complete